MDLAIFGAGGFGCEIASIMDKICRYEKERSGKEWSFIGFFDDSYPIGTEINSLGKIIGGMRELNSWTKPLDVAICLGNPRSLSIVRSKISNKLISFPNIIEPPITIDDPKSVIFGEGNIIRSWSAITTNTKIGNFNIINGMAVIGHDCKIEDYNVLMPKVSISGNVSIGSRNLFGAGSFVKQDLKIGNDVTLSPLSPLLTRPKDGGLYIGNPAKLVKF